MKAAVYGVDCEVGSRGVVNVGVDNVDAHRRSRFQVQPHMVDRIARMHTFQLVGSWRCDRGCQAWGASPHVSAAQASLKKEGQ